MRVLVSGATGLIGSALMRALAAAGHEAVALVRSQPRDGAILWNPAKPLDPEIVARFNALVNLAGKNIATRWTPHAKDEIAKSRVQTTGNLAQAIAAAYRRYGNPETFVAASAAGYYGSRGAELLTEESAPGKGFLADLCRQWESASDAAKDAGVRVVNVRTGIVLAHEGGALPKMLPAFRLGLGGKLGSGNQYWSWISLDDEVGAILFALQSRSLVGPVNLVGPEATTNAAFTRALGEELHRPAIFAVPELAVRAIFGEMGTETMLSSARIEPAKLKAAGYRFMHPDLRHALQDAIHRG